MQRASEKLINTNRVEGPCFRSFLSSLNTFPCHISILHHNSHKTWMLPFCWILFGALHQIVPESTYYVQGSAPSSRAHSLRLSCIYFSTNNLFANNLIASNSLLIILTFNTLSSTNLFSNNLSSIILSSISIVVITYTQHNY